MIFVGYSTGRRSGADAIRPFVKKLDQKLGGQVQPWEKMKVDGRVVINQVLEQIDQADMCIFDLTGPSENVLFEAGYAIARAKPIWLTLDTTIETAKSDWRDLAILNPIGYTGYKNSDDLLQKFRDEDPLADLVPVYDDLIEPVLPTDTSPGGLLYCSTFEPFEASNRLSAFIDNRRQQGLKVLISDPKESTLDSITWFAPKITQASGVLVHFAGAHRNRSGLHNRRHALVAGLAHGFERPLLMLAEEGYLVPFDYQTLLYKYESANDCVRAAQPWLDSLTFQGIDWTSPRTAPRSALSGIRFGEHVAENELTELIDYFVETAAFEEVISARDAIFVGHRGTGKTANATQAYEQVASNKNNLAVLIKPPGFEFPALFSLIGKLGDTQRDYFLDALWRFIIQTEIAVTALTRIEDKPITVPRSTAEAAFITYVAAAPFSIRADVSIRLEQALEHLLSILPENLATTGQATRNLINEAFHTDALVELRKELGPVLKDKERVAVFVDNLDKGWEQGANFKQVARLILGLLTARGRLVRDFGKQDYWRDRIKLTVAVFLRSDIYEYLRREAREPDKLPLSTIAWRDAATLLTVIETRFEVSKGGQSASELWQKYFCPAVNSQPTRDYITSVVLPRPRDIVYFCNAAVGRALDRRHDRVEEDDFMAAEDTYSQYAYEALLVENGVTIPEMKDALLGFLEAPALLTRRDVYACLELADLPTARHEGVLTKLILVSFLGLETKEGVFSFPEVGSGMERAYAQAARQFDDPLDQRFSIHRAFHSFLEICVA